MLPLSTASILKPNIGHRCVVNAIRNVYKGIRSDWYTIRRISAKSNTYIAFHLPFKDVTENATDLPNIKLSVSNVTRTIQRIAGSLIMDSLEPMSSFV